MGSGQGARACLSECSAPVFDCKSGGDRKEHFSPSGVWEYPELKKHLRKHAFWEEGYLVRAVGDAVTAAVGQRYLRYYRHEEHEAKQLKLFYGFWKAPPSGGELY